MNQMFTHIEQMEVNERLETSIDRRVPIFAFDSLQLHNEKSGNTARMRWLRVMREIRGGSCESQSGANWRKMANKDSQMFTQCFPNLPQGGETINQND